MMPSAPLLGTTVSQDLYHGNSVEQLDALVDLLDELRSIRAAAVSHRAARGTPFAIRSVSGAGSRGRVGWADSVSARRV